MDWTPGNGGSFEHDQHGSCTVTCQASTALKLMENSQPNSLPGGLIRCQAQDSVDTPRDHHFLKNHIHTYGANEWKDKSGADTGAHVANGERETGGRAFLGGVVRQRQVRLGHTYRQVIETLRKVHSTEIQQNII